MTVSSRSATRLRREQVLPLREFALRAHPTLPSGRSPRYRTAGVTSLRGSTLPQDIRVEIGRASQDGKTIYTGHGHGVFVQKTAIRLEMDHTILPQETTIPLQEHRRRQPLVLAGPELRIRKSKPDLRNLSRSEESRDELDAGTQEGHVAQALLGGRLGTPPETRPLDVDTYVVLVRIAPGKLEGIFPLATAKLQYDVALVTSEHLLYPVPLHGMVGQIGIALRQHLGGSRLQQAGESLVLGEFA